MVLLEENGMMAQQQVAVKVQYHGRLIGDYIADIVVENSVIFRAQGRRESS